MCEQVSNKVITLVNILYIYTFLKTQVVCVLCVICNHKCIYEKCKIVFVSSNQSYLDASSFETSNKANKIYWKSLQIHD
mgnify:CR=1 FL=1